MLKFITILAVATLALPAAEGTTGEAGQHHRGELRQQVLEKCDADKDGKLTESERAAARAAHSAQLKEKHPKLFAKIDSNGDGVISKEEGKAARQGRRERHQADK